MSEITLIGFKELAIELKTFPDKLKKKALGKVVRAGANVILKDARRRAPKRLGKLRKGIKVQRKRRQPRNIIRDAIGFTKDAWYGRLVEYGHNIVSSSGEKKVIGHVSAQPFLRPAFDNNINASLDAMHKKLEQEIGKMRLEKLKSGTRI